MIAARALVLALALFVPAAAGADIDGTPCGDWMKLPAHGKACDLCEDPRTQGYEAGELNDSDFKGFCNNCLICKGGPEQETKAVEDATEKLKAIEAQGKEPYSPPPCDLCSRPDVHGFVAGDLNDGDFKVFCMHCKSADVLATKMNLYATKMNLSAVQGTEMHKVGIAAAGIAMLAGVMVSLVTVMRRQTSTPAQLPGYVSLGA